jgi:hypothetical protein
VGPKQNLEAEKTCISFPGTFKIYRNPWEAQDQVIPIQ